MALFFAGEFIFIGLVAAACITSGGVLDFVDTPSLLFVLGGGLGVTLISFTLKDIGDAFSCVFGEEGACGKLRQAAYFWFALIRNLLAVGALGTLIGNIQMLGNLEDPSNIGPAMAVSLITIFYGIFFSAVLPLPAYFIVHRLLANASAE